MNNQQQPMFQAQQQQSTFQQFGGGGGGGEFPHQQQQKVCTNYMKGNCKFGPQCRFLHEQQRTLQVQQANQSFNTFQNLNNLTFSNFNSISTQQQQQFNNPNHHQQQQQQQQPAAVETISTDSTANQTGTKTVWEKLSYEDRLEFCSSKFTTDEHTDEFRIPLHEPPGRLCFVNNEKFDFQNGYDAFLQWEKNQETYLNQESQKCEANEQKKQSQLDTNLGATKGENVVI